MAKKKGADESLIEEKLLTSLLKRELGFEEIHDKIYRFSKKYKLDPNKVGKVIKRIMVEAFQNYDFSEKPIFQGHHHHGGH